jgi:hypothetical protein
MWLDLIWFLSSLFAAVLAGKIGAACLRARDTEAPASAGESGSTVDWVPKVQSHVLREGRAINSRLAAQPAAR